MYEPLWYGFQMGDPYTNHIMHVFVEAVVENLHLSQIPVHFVEFKGAGLHI